MAVYYNDDKKIFIESDLSSDVLVEKGYASVSILQLKVGENKNKTIWILEDYRETISRYGVKDCNWKHYEIVENKKVESLNEIRAYFAYLKTFIMASRPRDTYGDMICGKELENIKYSKVRNDFESKIPFEKLIPKASYVSYLKDEKSWVKGNCLNVTIPRYECTSKYKGCYAEYTYLYYPFISIIFSITSNLDSSFDDNLRHYNWIMDLEPTTVNYKYGFYDITGLGLEDIDFEDIYGSLVAWNSAKKNFELMISKNAVELENLRKRLVSMVTKEFENEFQVNEEVRKKYVADIAELIRKMDMLAGDSRFASLKEEFFKEIGNATQSNYLEFRQKLEQAINDIDNKRQETILLNKQLTDMISNARTQTEEAIKQIMVFGDKSIEELKRKFNDLEKKRELLVKNITEEVVREVVKRNPMQEINIKLSDDNINRKIRGVYHQAFKKVLQLVHLKTPVFLVGPAGCGKNVMLKQVAKVLDLEFYYINDAREKYDLLGFVDANGKYQETQFYKAFTKGGLLMIDELDSADASVLLLLNSALGTGDDFYMTFPDGNQYQAHPNFHLVAAANTFGTGANQTYNGRNQLDGASLNRFLTVPVDYDTNIEKCLTNNKDILPLYWEVRRIVRKNEINYVVSTRNILNADKFISAGVFSLDEVFTWTLVSSLQDFDLATIISNIETTDSYSNAFIDFVKRNYKIEDANTSARTRTKTKESNGW